MIPRNPTGRSGRPWTIDDVETLIERVRADIPIGEIAFELARTAIAIHSKMISIGLYYAEVRREPLIEVLKDVADRRGVRVYDITGPDRHRAIVHVRQEAMWEARQRTALSLPQLGARFGGRDHTTVLYGIRAHEKRMAEA